MKGTEETHKPPMPSTVKAAIALAYFWVVLISVISALTDYVRFPSDWWECVLLIVFWLVLLHFSWVRPLTRSEPGAWGSLVFTVILFLAIMIWYGPDKLLRANYDKTFSMSVEMYLVVFVVQVTLLAFLLAPSSLKFFQIKLPKFKLKTKRRS